MDQVLDHLWQSTFMALVAGLLVLSLRKASAGVRYRLWLAASIKFLIPFSVLAALGRYLAPSLRLPVETTPETRFIATAAQPFSEASLSTIPFAHAAALQAPVPPSLAPQSLPTPPVHAALHLDPLLILSSIWALGSAAVLVRWMIRWARVARIVRSARPIAWSAPMPVLASPALMEPGLVGFLRPVLVVPETLPERLSRSEIDAILAHEVSHLRRRDNLTASIHMLVEALFWFHPLVWWIGARLIAEREHACDEAVVRAGHDRAAYARSLVESSRLYLQSPLDCVAGASGANLKSRVEAIMTAPLSSPLAPPTKALLLAAGGCAFATPVAAGLLTSPEGQTAVAQVTAVASTALGAPLARPAPDQEQTPRPVVLARNAAVLAPALTVARRDASQTPLSQDIAAPRAVAPPPSAPQPVQLATAAPPQPRSTAAPPPLPTDPTEIKQRVADFVATYGAFTPGGFARSHQTGRWAGKLCMRVEGLTFEEAEAVTDRIEEVAKTVDLEVQPQDCEHLNLEVGFTTDPQGMLDNTVKHDARVLGDRSSATRNVKIATLPIQAWYVTNGVTFAENDRRAPTGDDLKVRVLYQAPNVGGVAAPPGFGGAISNNLPSSPPGGFSAYQPGSFNITNSEGGYGGPGYGYPTAPGAGAGRGAQDRLFLNVMVIVDMRKARGKSLALLADYVAMLALSEPGDLGQCHALPSVTDLFAACPDRPAPAGLTLADEAYLKALYAKPEHGVRPGYEEAAIAARMAKALANDEVASR